VQVVSNPLVGIETEELEKLDQEREKNIQNIQQTIKTKNSFDD